MQKSFGKIIFNLFQLFQFKFNTFCKLVIIGLHFWYQKNNVIFLHCHFSLQWRPTKQQPQSLYSAVK